MLLEFFFFIPIFCCLSLFLLLFVERAVGRSHKGKNQTGHMNARKAEKLAEDRSGGGGVSQVVV
jgi:uncharacterized membrane protein